MTITINKPKIALIYCRVSSVRQKIEGHGLDSQEHRCRIYAVQKDYEVEKVFRDSFTGGGDFMRRPAMKELIEYVDKNPHKGFIVVFDDLKRFARDTVFHWNLRRAFEARNLKPECLNFNFEDTPEGIFVETIMAAQGQLDREQNRRQVIQKQKARLEKGYWSFYQPPGYKFIKDPLHGKLLAPKEGLEPFLIKEALEGFATGRFLEQMDVLRFLVSRNYYKNRKSKKRYVEDVKRLLNRAYIYAGYIEYKPWEVSLRRGHHKPLIDFDICKKIQDRLSGKVRTQSRQDIHPDFPARGFIACNICNKALTASWSKGRNRKFAYYRCKTSNCDMQNKSIRRDDIEKGIGKVLLGIKPKRSVLLLTKVACLDIWHQRMKDLVVITKQREQGLQIVADEKEAFIARVVTTQNEVVIKEYEKKIEELSIKEIALKEKIKKVNTPRISFETALNKVFEVLENPYFKWEKGDLYEKRLVLKLVFTELLRFDYHQGFETASLALPLRVFEHFVNSKLQDVEMLEVESRSEMITQDFLQAYFLAEQFCQ